MDVLATEQTDNTVALMLGNGTGAYPTVTHIPAGTNPLTIVKGDFNEDTNLDFIVSSNSTANLYQMLGNGDGTFAAAVALPLPFTPIGVLAEDLNHDDNLDLVASPQSVGTVAVLLGDGSGGFGAVTTFAAGPTPSTAVLGDFDGDTHLDIVVPNVGTSTISVLSGVGNGSFGAPVQVTLPGAVAVQRVRRIDDVTGDDKPDLSVTVSVGGAENSLYLLVNNGADGFLAPVEIVGPLGVVWAASGDLNKDGKSDLVALNREAQQLLVLHGTGGGAFGPATTYNVGEVRNYFELSDLNGDGRLDIVGPAGEEASVFVMLNTCASTEVADVSLSVTGPTSGTAGDVVTYTITATNHGPAVATGIVVIPNATDGFEFISSDCTQTTAFSCEAASIAVDESASWDVTLRVYGGTQSAWASVTSLQADPDTSNNFGTITTVVAPAPIDFVVTNTLDDFAPGSLRYAIEQSNNNAGSTNTISFNIGAPGSSQTIAPQSPIEAITTPVVIDGWTQGGAGYTGPPLIELNGASVPPFNAGLYISAGGSTVRGLAINGFNNSGGSGITVQVNGGNVIQGNYIGTNLAGTAASPNNIGILVQAPNTIIGGATPAERNVISGNSGNGVSIGAAGGVVTSSGQGSTVLGNYIGLNAAGTAALANNTGINVQAPNVTVGGTTAAERNVISGNIGNGVFVGASQSGGVITSSGQGSTVLGNYIGVDPGGTAARANGNGVTVQAPNVTVGTPSAGNVISGNTNVGVNVSSATLPGTPTSFSTPTNTLIQNNRIGTDAFGTIAVPNNIGLQLVAGNPRVGGTAANTGNLISGNTTNGINISFQSVLIGGVQTFVGRSNGVIVEGNTIGLNLAGTAAIGNQTGIRIGTPNAMIGGTVAGAGNVIAGNTTSGGISVQRNLLNGVLVADGNGAQILGNLIGTNAAGSATIGNGGNGVGIFDVSNVTVGSVGDGRNVIARNTSGVSVSGSAVAVTGIRIAGNYIGLAPDGTTARGNTSNGVTLISGSISGTVVEQNVISANVTGVQIGSGATGTLVQGNLIGTDLTGMLAVPNTGVQSGININGGNNIIGGSTATARNVISGNTQHAVTILGASAINNTVQGNYIGVDITGQAALGNGAAGSGIGVDIVTANNNTIEGNVISGNGTGMQLRTGATGNLVQGNFIGTNATGDAAIRNHSMGVRVSAADGNTFGGTAAGAGNLISGNGTATSVAIGLWLGDGSDNNVVQGNRIGTNEAGTSAVPNTGDGLSIENSHNNTVGGTAAGAGNLVSGNGGLGHSSSGISVRGTSSVNVIRGNLIGTDVSGTFAVANTIDGVLVMTTSADNVIGGIGNGEGNTIAFNAAYGVGIAAGGRVSVRGNAIFGNGLNGIDLGRDGTTPNDAGDGDPGANGLQNFPVLAAAFNGSTIVDGSINTIPNTAFDIDFYATASCVAARQGQRYLGSITTTTNGSGDATFHAVLAGVSVPGEFITATATDPFGQTSELSNCPTVIAGANLAVTLSHQADPYVGAPYTYTATVSNAGPTTATGVTLTQTLPASVTFVPGSSSPGCAFAAGVVTCPVGALALGGSAEVTIAVDPTASEFVNTTVSVAAAEPDPTPADNSANDSVLVLPFAPCSSAVVVGPAFYNIGSGTGSLNALADFNEDGNLDTFVIWGQGAPFVSVLLGDGSGGFGAPNVFDAPGGLSGLITGDFNNDQHVDVAVSDPNGLKVLIGIGNGDGTVGDPPGGVDPSVPITPFSLDKGDLNGDGNLDIVVGATSGSSVAVLLGNGDGSFAAATTYASGANPFNVVVADFDHDSKLDIAVPNSSGTTISILKGNGNGTFAAPTAITVPGTVGRLRSLGDVNRDGWPDLGVTIANGSFGLLVLLNNQSGGFQTPIQLLSSINTGFVPPAADMNGDGNLDLVAAGAGTGRLYVLYGDGAGGFPSQDEFLVGLTQNIHWIADLNGDQRPDIVGVRPGADNLYVFLNTCSASSDVAELSVTLSGPATAAADDHITYLATVTNNGPTAATGVRLYDTLPTGMSFESATGDLVGSCVDQTSGMVSCTLPPIASGTSAQVSFNVWAFAAGARTNQVMAFGQQHDNDWDDNVASFTTTVSAGPVTFEVTNTADFGTGSLRQAITNSNANAGSTNTIAFNIAGPGVKTIQPLTGLPAATVPVVIDATTQPGFTGTPIIEVNGASTSGVNGLQLNASAAGSTIRGFVVNRFSIGGGVGGTGILVASGAGTGGNLIVGNYIGTDPTGTIARPNTTGIGINGANNIIGGTNNGDGNLIAANTGSGINVNAGSNGTQIYGNLIGTNIAGAALGNGSDGIRINNASNVIVGSVGAGRNVISGNCNNGVVTGCQGVFANASSASMSGIQIVGNYIGVAPSGTTARPNYIGVGFTSSGGFTISGTVIDQNVISGNTQFGINLGNSGPTGTVITGNVIGLNAASTASIANAGGIFVPAPNTMIGGTTAAAANVIAGNAGNAVSFNPGAGGSQLLGNLIGTNSSGAPGLGNGVAAANSGVSINNVSNITIGSLTGTGRNVIVSSLGNGINVNASTVSITGLQVVNNYLGVAPDGVTGRGNGFSGVALSPGGGFTISNTLIDRNVASGNTQHGIHVVSSGATGTLITGNVIGLNAAGAAALGNTQSGVFVSGPNTVIGGTTVPSANVIAGNGGSGVSLSTGATGSQVFGNLVGTNASGAAGLGNGGAGNSGVSILNVSNITVGSLSGTGRNVIVSSAGSGMNVNANAASITGIQIVNNYIGVAPDGITARGNAGQGVSLSGSGGFTLAGTVIDRNVISSSTGAGVNVENSGATGTVIMGNVLGLDAAATVVRGNGVQGVRVAGPNTMIGGTTAGSGNVIGGNLNAGIFITAGSGGTQVFGNLIGTNASGAAGLGNGVAGGNRGVWIADVSNVTVGSLTGTGRNVIVGSGGSGVFIGASAAAMTGISVTNNYIGLAPDGVTARANNSVGVNFSSSGGFGISNSLIDRNVISGNTSQGINLVTDVTGTTITGNLIGTTAAGTAAVANGSDGLRISGAAGSVIGGTGVGAANTIVFNTGAGISVISGTGNAVRANSIHDNGGIGIDLGGGGSTPNDLGDPDTGPNNFQNFPTITAVNAAGTIVDGSFNGAANTTFNLDFFASATCDPSTFGEGERYLGSATVVTNGTGNVTFSVTPPATAAAGESVTATATDPLGNTSEFSACFVVP